MKKQLFFILFSVSVFSVSAQNNYKYYLEQETPFQGEYLEPRYHDVDSIVKESYFYLSFSPSDNYGKRFADISQNYSFEEPPSGYNYYFKFYTLLSKNDDGLVDTLRNYVSERPGEQSGLPVIKKYTADDQLIYVGKVDQNFTSYEAVYAYDSQGRISKKEQTIVVYEADTDSLITEFSYAEYDYENGIIHRELSDIYFDYTHNGYIIADTFTTYQSIHGGPLGEVEHIDKKTYIFDSKNRLETIDGEYTAYSPIFYPDSLTTKSKYNYKYTKSGYEGYADDELDLKVTFQEDGYCTEVVHYRDSLTVISLKRYAYFKNGREVSNAAFEPVIPQAHGVQGGIVLNVKRAAAISIYALGGSLVKKTNVGEGNTMIPLSKGIYIVRIADLSVKVLVK